MCVVCVCVCVLFFSFFFLKVCFELIEVCQRRQLSIAPLVPWSVQEEWYQLQNLLPGRCAQVTSCGRFVYSVYPVTGTVDERAVGCGNSHGIWC